MGNNDFIEKELSKLKENNNFRELKSSNGIDFSSNDYLGLTNHPRIKKALITAINSGVSFGSGGSRLLTGNKEEHVELEEFAADYFNSEACLFFNSGFLTNYALFTTLPQRKDFIIYDELSHASIRDGIKASDTKSVKFKHNDIASLKKKIQKAQSLNVQNIWISIESVYSMDGDIAPIKEIIELIKNYKNIYLIIDEAHATGIFGKYGKGFTYGLKNKNIITLHTCSKALGVSGALICATKEIIEFLINKSRPFIYTTAESPLIAVAVKEALIISQEESWRRENLLELIDYTNKYLHSSLGTLPNKTSCECFVRGRGLGVRGKTQIIPIILETNQQVLDTAANLQEQGFDVRAIRPPTVPAPRLRISLNTNRTKEEVDKLFSIISQ